MKINLTPFAAFIRPLYTESGRSGRSNDKQLTTQAGPSLSTFMRDKMPL